MALDGKCSISCDSEVTMIHTKGKKLNLGPSMSVLLC